MPNAKGVDFILYNSNIFAMVEVKNCSGDEGNNRWRISADNKKKRTSKTAYDVGRRESLDIEVAQKVAMSIAALCGAGSFGDRKKSSEELEDYFDQVRSEGYANGTKTMMVILFLEGDFASKTRTEKMILKGIQDSLRKKLCWLNCKVSVVNSNTYNEKLFQVTKEKT